MWPNVWGQILGAKIFLEKNMELNNLIKEIYILSKKNKIFLIFKTWPHYFLVMEDDICKMFCGILG